MSEIILRIKNSRFHNSVFELLIRPFLQHKNQNWQKFIQVNKTQFRKLRKSHNNMIRTLFRCWRNSSILQHWHCRRTVFTQKDFYSQPCQPLTPKVSIFDESQYNHTMSGSCWGGLGEGVLLLVLPVFLVSLALGSSLSSPTWSKYERITDKKCKLITVAVLLRK